MRGEITPTHEKNIINSIKRLAIIDNIKPSKQTTMKQKTQSEVTVNESKHTPGPWEAHKTGGTKNYPTYLILSGTEPGEQSQVAILYTATMDNAPYQESNARLIAAAPDMLEALTTIVENASKANVPGEYYLHELALNYAKTAIQKATSHA